MKNVVITGVSGGLGRCLAKEYLKDGCHVTGYDVEERKIEEYVKDYGAQFVYERLDVGKEDKINEQLKRLGERIFDLDLLINCAGVLPANSEKVLEDFEIEDALQVFNINALGPLRMVKAALPLLRKADRAVIVNISSEAGSMQAHADYTFRYDYCMSKAALNIQSIILQRYLEEEKIRVLTVHPGWMKTFMGGENAPLLPEEAAAKIKELIKCHQYDYQNRVFLDYNDAIRPW